MLVACKSREPAGAPDAAPREEPPPITRQSPADPAPEASVAKAPDSPSWAFDCTANATPTSGKSIGHTSVVFKVELSNGKKAAWKPNAKKVTSRYRGEIAAYRLAQALGLPNVPPACAWTFDAPAAREALAKNADASRLFADEAIVEDGRVHGVVIPWIDGLRFWPLEKDPLRSEVHAWLRAGEVPPQKLDLARQASDLVVFDFLTGNWDRYSGENVGIDASGTWILFIDNDAGFMDKPPPDQLARNKALVESTTRFSRSLVIAARGLDREGLRKAFGDEGAGRPLLPDTVVSAVHSRLVDLLAIVDAKIREHGEDATLYFR